MRKFEAMLSWARHKIRTKTSSKLDAKLEFKCIMERLARDLKLYRISPQELIKVCTEFKFKCLSESFLIDEQIVFLLFDNWSKLIFYSRLFYHQRL